MKKPKKRFSQNFLVDHGLADRIVAELDIGENDVVFEIGGGRGILSVLLAPAATRLFVFELDRDLVDHLQSLLTGHDNVTVVEADFLKVDPDDYHDGPFRVIGNIPYDITSPLIEWIMLYYHRITRAVITTQRELAERLSSEPGGKQWAPIAVFSNCFFTVRKVMDIYPESFYPRPGVMSSTLVFEPKKTVIVENRTLFEKIVRMAFAQRRKLLTNNLSRLNGLDKKDLEKIVSDIGLDKTTRAEQVSLDDFIELTRKIEALGIS